MSSPEPESGMATDEEPTAFAPSTLDPGATLEEQPEVEEAMLNDTIAPGLADPDADEPDPDAPVFQEPGGPPTTPTA